MYTRNKKKAKEIKAFVDRSCVLCVASCLLAVPTPVVSFDSGFAQNYILYSHTSNSDAITCLYMLPLCFRPVFLSADAKLHSCRGSHCYLTHKNIIYIRTKQHDIRTAIFQCDWIFRYIKYWLSFCYFLVCYEMWSGGRKSGSIWGRIPIYRFPYSITR